MRKLSHPLTLSLLLSLVLGLFHPAILMAEEGAEPEDLSIYKIEGETDETYLGDHLDKLLEIIDEQGYELKEDASGQSHSIRLGWMGFMDNEARDVQTIFISDSPYDNTLSFGDRPLMINYTANRTDDKDVLEVLVTDIGDALPFKFSDPELPEPDFVDAFHGTYLLDETDSALRYLFMKSESLSESPPYVYLVAQIYPLIYNDTKTDTKGIEAIVGLADYLYSRQESIEAPYEILAEAMLKASPESATSRHIISYRSSYSMGDSSTLTHTLHFDAETSDDDLQAALVYLADQFPNEVDAITGMVMEVPEGKDTAELKGNNWTARLNRQEEQTVFMLLYEIENEEH